jgi:hypothetical protein
MAAWAALGAWPPSGRRTGCCTCQPECRVAGLRGRGPADGRAVGAVLSHGPLGQDAAPRACGGRGPDAGPRLGHGLCGAWAPSGWA